ncbi:MAG: SPOR domain-containing protein [Flammeovirgaceae bacterium]|nr:SPOR domain-containing protein [Flammeovirgaceae bacterium]
MRKLILSIITSFFILSGFTGYSQSDKFYFFDGSYKQLQTRSLNSKKPYFVYFYANWSRIAKKMNDEVFASSAFVNYAESKYLGLKVDGESIIDEGEALATQYGVLYFPSILIFTPEGKLMDRISGFQATDKIIAKLKQYENATGAPEPSISESEIQMVSSEKPGEHLFKISAKRQARSGFGVQVATYSNYRNAFTKLLELENEKFHKNVLVFIKESDPQNLQYKVILGPFINQEQADAYLKILQKQPYYKGTVLVEMSDL